MLQKEQWTQIHVLKAQGVSEREIARRLGISRNTVARYLSAEEVPRYKPREPRPTKLGAFEAYILERMTAASPRDHRCAGAAARVASREAKFIRVERGTFELVQYDKQIVALQSVQERQATFDKDVTRALADTSAVRRKRLSRSNKKPTKIKAVTEIYIRSADVVAKVLLGANGTCELQRAGSIS